MVDDKQPDTFHEVHAGGLAISMTDFPYQAMLDELLDVYNAKIAKNRLRSDFYEMRYSVPELAMDVPDELRNLQIRVNWPAKAVDALAVRSRFDGFSVTDPDAAAILDRMVSQSNLKHRYRQDVQSELIYSCVAMTVSKGGAGEPEILLASHSAEVFAAVWDYRRGRVAYAITFVDFDKNGNITECNLYTDDAVVNLRKADGLWSWTEQRHSMGRPLIEVLAYRPTWNRPFGQSRITKAVRDLTLEMSRECKRTAVQSECYSLPQKWMFGVDMESTAGKTKGERYVDSWLFAGRDDDGNIPAIGMLQPATMSPHLDYMRTLAAQFSGATDVPVSTLGVLHDQAASAESIYAASEGLIIAAQDLNDVNRIALQNVAKMAIAAAKNKPLNALTEEEADVVANFANPAMPSIVSQADAMVKVTSAVPAFAGTDVFFEQLGFSEDLRRKAKSQMLENETRAAINDALFGGENG